MEPTGAALTWEERREYWHGTATVIVELECSLGNNIQMELFGIDAEITWNSIDLTFPDDSVFSFDYNAKEILPSSYPRKLFRSDPVGDGVVLTM